MGLTASPAAATATQDSSTDGDNNTVAVVVPIVVILIVLAAAATVYYCTHKNNEDRPVPDEDKGAAERNGRTESASRIESAERLSTTGMDNPSYARSLSSATTYDTRASKELYSHMVHNGPPLPGAADAANYENHYAVYGGYEIPYERPRQSVARASSSNGYYYRLSSASALSTADANGRASKISRESSLGIYEEISGSGRPSVSAV